jgi:hypothetical protein
MNWLRMGGLAVLVASAPAASLAQIVPSTFVTVQAHAGGPFGGQNQSFFDARNGPTVESASVSGTGGGNFSSASAIAAADFGALGIIGNTAGLAPPAPGSGVDGSALAEAQWTDVFTPIANPGSGLVAGAPASTQVQLSIPFLTSLFADNASASFDYRLALVRVDPVTQASTVLLDDCFTSDVDTENCFGATIIGVPGNLGPPAVVDLITLALPVFIEQPFVLNGVMSVSASGGTLGDVGGNFTASVDSLDPQQTFLTPVGDFSLVSGSGHDYSVAGPPPGPPTSVPESPMLPMVIFGLAAAWMCGRNARKLRR